MAARMARITQNGRIFKQAQVKLFLGSMLGLLNTTYFAKSARPAQHMEAHELLRPRSMWKATTNMDHVYHIRLGQPHPNLHIPGCQ